MPRLHDNEVKAAYCNINLTKAPGSDKVPVASGPRLYLPVDKYLQQIEGGDQSPSRMESSQHQANPDRREGHTEDGDL